jgi:hypothetical protein
MYLMVDMLDLKSEFINTLKCQDVKFEHFKEDVQEIITLLGGATLHEPGTKNYQLIAAPVEQTWWNVIAIDSGDKIAEHVELEKAISVQRACNAVQISTMIEEYA